MNAHDLVFRIHTVVSSAFAAVALTVTIWSIVGWVKKLDSNRLFNRLSFFYIHLLYLQLFTGITLYFFLKPPDDSGSITLEQALEHNSLRFWAIEHVSLMLFALILAQTGRILIKQMKNDFKKYRAATFYLGVSFLVVVASVAMALFR